MRNLAACYSEHAVKVSDSYCSGPLNKSSYVSPKSIPSIQNIVTCTYKSKIFNQKPLFITITWCSKLICQGFFIKFSEKLSNSKHGFHQISKLKGSKSLLFDSSKIDLHWDLSAARFESIGPVPSSGFYVAALLVDTQSAIILGEVEHDEAIENAIAKMAKPETGLVSQYEQYTGQWHNQINSKAKIWDSGVEHEITIKCSPEDDGPRSPVLSVYVDKKRVVRVKKLQWNFRGNQVIFVDGFLVDVMWDVYGWYFDPNGSAFFMFRTRRGLDTRLWFEQHELERERDYVDDKNKKFSDNKPEFSLLICASNKK